MREFIIYISILLGVLACKNEKTHTPESRNIMGEEGGVKKEISNPEQNEKQAKFSDEVIKLNEKATLFITKRNYTSYQEALKLLDKAIRLDTTFYMAYLNKAQVLIKLGKYNDAIDISKYLVSSIKPDFPEAYTMLGMLYDKVGETSTAKDYYKKAIEKYSDRISKKDNVMDIVNRAHLNYILDKEKGLNEIDSLIKVYPKNEELLLYKEYLFLGYNHQKALDDL